MVRKPPIKTLVLYDRFRDKHACHYAIVREIVDAALAHSVTPETVQQAIAEVHSQVVAEIMRDKLAERNAPGISEECFLKPCRSHRVKSDSGSLSWWIR